MGSLSQAADQTISSMEAIRRRHTIQSSRFLQVLRKVELLRCTHIPFHAEENRLSTCLEELRRGLQAPSARLLDISSVQAHVHRNEDSINSISDEDLKLVLVVSNITI